ncbi:mechanosensitive ion channel family protein [Sinorhizobium sp. RAC02]|uniref:mechanosensitive ion channel family protein n=1 Tax=Sinorhizobium sp. RAC02 TaxID=1842534 RepID=UPI00083D8F01|nr:mechanosensitive ion channel family protein [Sinorhizobium sp. RAC02]AOF93765.1 mechanosensitive ion channel family protein [Sinorhizobium sp. RAC02]
MTTVRTILHCKAACIAIILLLIGFAFPAQAQEVGTPPADKLREISRLLADPDVAAWLNSAQAGETKANESKTDQTPVAGAEADMQSGYVAEKLGLIQERIDTAMQGGMEFGPGAQTAMTRLEAEVTQRGPLRFFLLLLLVPLLAIGAERLFNRLSARHWRRQAAGPMADPVGVVPIGLHACGQAICFALGALLPLALVAWPPLLARTALILAIAAIVIRFSGLLGAYIVWLLEQPVGHALPVTETSPEVPPVSAEIAPAVEMPPPELAVASESKAAPVVSEETASVQAAMPEPDGDVSVQPRVTPERVRYWFSRFQRGLRVFIAGWTVVELMRLFGFSQGALLLVIFAFDLALFVIAVDAFWRRPYRADHSETARKIWSWLATVAFILLLVVWIAGLRLLFWGGVVALLLPPALRLTTAVVARLHGGSETMRPTSMGFVIGERGARALVIILSAWWVASVAGVDAAGMMMGSGDTVVSRVAHAVTQAIAVLLVADILWQFVKSDISARMANEPVGRRVSDEERSRNARIRTLLPILRNMLSITLAIVAVMMALTSLGVDIGPLIAGAGVAGVAIGFGAQTIVKDLISGIFYLWDDAFRIGEYIETGKYKGVVESFSLRSVKLRHHRGPLTTVPFGELGAVQNMSRDWSVTKFNISVPYDTDLEKLRKVIKRIGTDIAEKPEYKESLLEPLKMKGVGEFGEYAIIVRVGFTTKPGEQFMIRREIMNRIKLDFKANGIQFASPTVQVGGHHSDADAAVAEAHRRRQEALAAANGASA